MYNAMSVTLLIVIFGIWNIETSLAEEPAPLKCLQCPKVRNSSECDNITDCPVGMICRTSAFYTSEGLFYSYDCGAVEMCNLSALSLIGKRFLDMISTDTKQALTSTHIKRDTRIQVCVDCCRFLAKCNRYLCSKEHFMKSPQITSTTITPMTTMPLTTIDPVDPNCRDREEDGIKCDLLDLAKVCTDTSMFAQVLRWKKCPKTCGLCHGPENASSAYVTPPPGNVCKDFEQDGIRCVYLDLFDMCTDRSSRLSILVTNEKCRQHCGICHDTTTTQSTTTTTTTTTPAPTTTTRESTTTTTTLPETTTTQATITTEEACEDKEDAAFTCREWASHGYCLSFPGPGYDTALVRCRKFCGFCH